MLWWLLQNTIIAAVLALGVLVVCRWRRISPAGRHLLWLVVLVKLVTPPFVVWPWAVPRWHERVGVGCPEFHSPSHALSQSETSGGEWNSGHPTPSTVTPDNGAVVRSETFVVTLPAKKHDGTPPAEKPSSVVHPRDVVASATRRAGSVESLDDSGRSRSRLAFGVLVAWGSGGLLYFALQIVRIHRMASRLRAVEPPPDWLADEIRRWAERLRVSPPTTCLVPGVSSPFLWSLRRVRLIWPQGLTTEATLDAWRGVIVHELAHLKRRDHWVGWLELIASCVWWWNPLFWYVRNQIRENAELACDAWVVETLPGGRRQYAEALLTVCEHISRPVVPAVAVGVGGARRNLERRLTMILRDRVPFRVSRGLLCAAGVLALLILPGWAQPPEDAADPNGLPPTGKGSSVKVTKPNPTEDPVRSNRPTSAKATTLRSKLVGPEDAGGPTRTDTKPRPNMPARPILSDPAPNPESRVRQLETQLRDLQRQIRAMRGQPATTNLPSSADAFPRVRLRTDPLSTKPEPVRNFDPGMGRPKPGMSRNTFNRSNEEVVATRTITLQRTTYRVAASRAKALEAFLKLHVKAEVLQIELGQQTVRIPTGGMPMGPMGGGIGGPMGAGGMAPAATVSVMTITTTPDVQKAIGGIIALMRKSDIPGSMPRADTPPGGADFGPRTSGAFGPASGVGGAPGSATPTRPGFAPGGIPTKSRGR